ncbi:MAG: hypothetical protein ACI3X6_01315 [Alloprevotella sp.]
MFTNDDTRTVNANASKSANAKKTDKGEKIKMAAATVAGAALGGTAAMAATAMGEEVEIAPEEQPYDEPQIDEQEVVEEETEQQEQEQPEPEPAPEPKPEPKPASKPQPAPKPEQEQNSFFRNHKVQIEKIETVTADDGTVAHTAVGTVDGHRAVFIDDGQGNVRVSIVDENNNGTADENEFQELTNQNIRISDLAEHMQTPAEPQNVHPASDTGGGTTGSNDSVRVIAVHEGVETSGGLVNVATLIVDDTPVMMVDANRDGYADTVAIDENHNGNFEENEIHEVQDNDLVMPTQAAVEGRPMTAQIDGAEDGLPDYSNDADITAYQV